MQVVLGKPRKIYIGSSIKKTLGQSYKGIGPLNHKCCLVVRLALYTISDIPARSVLDESQDPPLLKWLLLWQPLVVWSGWCTDRWLVGNWWTTGAQSRASTEAGWSPPPGTACQRVVAVCCHSIYHLHGKCRPMFENFAVIDSEGKSQTYIMYVYSVSQKNIPPEVIWIFFIFFINVYEFLMDFLHTYYTFLCTLDYKFLFNYRATT